MSIAVVLGTRPEIIKLAPVVQALRESDLQTSVLYTGQHAEDGAALCDFFGLDAVKLKVRREASLNRLLAAQIVELESKWVVSPPKLVIVQGDTISCLAGAIAGSNLLARVAHVEAGLRTPTRSEPFPEEQIRRVVTQLTDLHFAPTEAARQNLIAYGVSPDDISVVGNTGIDACRISLQDVFGVQLPERSSRVVVTAHRRESWAEGISNVVRASSLLAERFPEHEVLVIRHPHPDWQKRLPCDLLPPSNWHLSRPLSHGDMIKTVATSELLITDSGGLQEEAAFLGTPTLVTRRYSDRPESIQKDGDQVVGTDVIRILESATKMLTKENSFASSHAFGDGFASERIVKVIQKLEYGV